MNLKIEIADDSKLDGYIDLLDEVGAWLWKKGIKQWEPGIHRQQRNRIMDLVANGYLVLAHSNSDLAGGCILSRTAPQIWQDDAKTIYLYSLVVARFAAGKEVGREIINFCRDIARKDQIAIIRLDCWDGNDFLKSFYQNQGFSMLDAVSEKDYRVRLFELTI